ncbi:MAG: extracellular solute-binding protein, partial [Ignavibacteria bacterium]|nr:extracellular solute-binding protein [Ignavibacteria bacterium]
MKKEFLYKRAASLLLFISMYSSFLIFGCARKENPNEIVIWHNMRPEEKNILQRHIAKYCQINPDIKVTQIYKETETMRSDYIIATVGGQGPDLIYGPSDQVGPFVEMQLIKPIDEIFPQDYLAHFNEKALIKMNGKIWQIADKLGNHLTLVYNKKLVPTPPKTDQELIQIGKKITKDLDGDGKIDQYGLVWNYTEPYFFIPFLTGFGGWVLDSLNNPTLNTAAMIRALKFIAELRDKYKIIPNEADYDIADVLFKEGKAGMIINGDWSWSSYGNAGIDYGISVLPRIEETGLNATPMVAPKGYSININVSEQKLLKIKNLLEFLLSPEHQLETTLEVKTFPTRNEVFQAQELLNDSILINSKKQIEQGRTMPIVTEMRAIWDAMRPPYQAVLGGAISPESAAKQMQSLAEIKIKELKESDYNPTFGLILQIVLLILVILLLIYFRKTIVAFFTLFKNNVFAYALFLPAMVVMIAVIVYPFFYNIILSFSNMSLAHINDWSIIGLTQYYKVFSEPQFYEIFLKTVIWTIVNLFFHVTIGVTLAILLNRNLPGKTIFRVLLILPWAIPQ